MSRNARVLAVLALVVTGAGRFGSSASAAEAAKRILFFHRSQTFEHSVVKEENGQPCFAERIMRPIFKERGWEMVSSKDGTIFTPENLAKFDALLFYTTGDLTAPGGRDGGKPMTPAGKAAMLEAVRNGKGFVGLHCASDTFHTDAERFENQPAAARDPYIRMIGGEFIKHGAQQSTTMTAVDNAFPGFQSAGRGFEMHEEWYALKNFADDIHVLLINQTAAMKGFEYERPPFPATWARLHGKGRVFYSSMGHREDVWESEIFQRILVGGISWSLGQKDADLTPNLTAVAPKAHIMPPPPSPAQPKAKPAAKNRQGK